MTDSLQAALARDLDSAARLSLSDYGVLAQLSEADGWQLRMTELATRLGWSKSRLSHQVGRMSARGLVRRGGCPSDARGTFAILTDDGFDTVARVAPLHLASVRRLFIDSLDRCQLSAMAEISRTVISGIAGGYDGGCDTYVSAEDDSGSQRPRNSP